MEASCFGFEEDDDPVDSNGSEKSCPVRFVKPRVEPTFRFVCNVQSKSKAVDREAVPKVQTPEVQRTINVSSPIPENPVSITQVQELLLQDISPTRDSSFYEELQNDETENEEKDTPVRVRAARKKRLLQEMEDESTNDENIENPQRTPARIIARPQTKKPLGEIQNFDDSCTPVAENVAKKGKTKNAEKTPVRVFTRPARKKKPADAENLNVSAAKPVAKRKGKKDVENERKEQLMNEMAEQINSKFKTVEDYQLVIE